MNHQNSGPLLAPDPVDDPLPRVRRIDGSINAGPVVAFTPEPRHAWLHLPPVKVDSRTCVQDHLVAGFVSVPVGSAAINVYSGDQARAFIVAFARAAELLDQHAAQVRS